MQITGTGALSLSPSLAQTQTPASGPTTPDAMHAGAGLSTVHSEVYGDQAGQAGEAVSQPGRGNETDTIAGQRRRRTGERSGLPHQRIGASFSMPSGRRDAMKRAIAASTEEAPPTMTLSRCRGMGTAEKAGFDFAQSPDHH